MNRIVWVWLLTATLCLACDEDTNTKQDTASGDVTGNDVLDTTGIDTVGMDTTGMDINNPDTVTPGGERVDCEAPLTPPASGLCEVTAGSDTHILLEGTVLAGSKIYENGGGVLIDTNTGRITCTGCDCASSTEGGGATRVTCADGVISPGLINAHDHTGFAESGPEAHNESDGTPIRYDHRTDWRQGVRGHRSIRRDFSSNYTREGILYGELRQLFGGATSLVGAISNADASGLVRNLDNSQYTEGLAGVEVEYSTFPLGDLFDPALITTCNYNYDDGSSALQNPIYYPHISEGIDAEAQNEFRCLSTNDNGGRDLIESNTTLVHGIGLTPIDIFTMASEGAKLIWSPRTNVDLYGMTANVVTMRNLGVVIGLGSDWAVSGSINMLRELQCADYLNQNHYDTFFSDYELWQMATVNNAIAMGAGEQIGTLNEGYFADIVIFDGSVNTDYRAVIDANVDDISLILRAGEPLLGDENVIGNLVPTADLQLCEQLDLCGTPKRLCIERDAGLTLGAVRNAVEQASYPLFFCEDPNEEPSCVPFRPNEYTGIGSAEDTDGDGITDPLDNCPRIFNPPRPLENNEQGDVDGDGQGDACDFCPLSAEPTCDSVDPEDLDGDGFPNLEDVCPSIADDQTDSDSDGTGDACDDCPDFANPGGSACPATIYDVKKGDIAEGRPILVTDAIVTGVLDGEGFFIQVDPDDAQQYAGVDFSGVYVFDRGNSNLPARGDIVDVEGTITNFFGQLELTNVTTTIASSGNTLPPAETAALADAVTGGARADALEGVLVTLSDLEVQELQLDFDEFRVSSIGTSTPTVSINDFFYVAEPFPTVGETFTAITGIMRFSFSEHRLSPRDAADIASGPPLVASITPDSIFLSQESSTPLPSELSVNLTRAAVGDTVIDITYTNDAGVLTGPATVTVLDGQQSVALPLTATAAATTPVTIDATLDGRTVSATVRVFSDTEERNVASLSPNPLSLLISESGTLTVALDIPAASGNTTVDIASTGTVLTSVPGTVDVLSGELTAEISVTAGSAEGSQDVAASVGARAAQTATVDVLSSPFSVVITEVFYDHSGDDTSFEWVNLYNTTNTDIDLTGYKLAWGGSNYTNSSNQVTLSGTIFAKSCFLIGGPGADSENGNPASFDQDFNFSNTLQNSGNDADGVALFDTGTITSSTKPIFAVLYGGANNNNLLDESEAAVGDVDVDDADPGSSIRRKTDGTWEIITTPTPNACPPY